MEEYFLHPNTIVAFLLSFVVSLYVTNVIIKYSLRVGIGDEPLLKRKIHTKRTPNLGGIAVFIATMVAYFAFSDYNNSIRPDKIFSISILLFFVGIKDDFEPLTPKIRLLFEFLCAFFIIYITDVRLLTLWGIFGISTLPVWASYILSSLFIVTCINAYNLIDGIDGLLGSISLLGAICFGILFNMTGEWLWTLLCVALCGSLIGFLIYNWHPAKIFMGNGGALFLGTIFACFALKFMQNSNVLTSENIHIAAPHTIALSIISLPLIDLICVFIYRIISGYPPFVADNRHIHHRFLAMGLNHTYATLILLLSNILVVLFAYWVQDTGALISLVLTICFALFLNILVFYLEWQVLFMKSKSK